MSKKRGEQTEPRVYCTTTGAMWEALHGNSEALQQVKDVNCFVPLEDFNKLRYMTALLLYVQRLK